MNHFRIYYGALEQANHFVKPAIIDASPNASVDLVRLGRYCERAPKTAISAIHEWKDPDILVTVIRDDGANLTEAPLFTIEFTTAAFTKDHELQKFDNYIPLLCDDFIAIKISPTKKSAGDHGGDTDYNYMMPLALVERHMGATPYHFDWAVDKTMSRVVLDKKYLSCPPDLPGFKELVADCIAEYNANVDGWIERVCEGSPERLSWRNRLRDMDVEDVTRLSSQRTMYKDGALELKINRMGHAMDPERGMLYYYGILTSPLTVVFIFDSDKKTWYDGAPQSARITGHVVDSGMSTPFDYAMCFALGTSIDVHFKDVLDRVRLGETEVDINSFVDQHYESLNKPIKAIFSFSDRLKLKNGNGDTMVTFTYRRHRVHKVAEKYPPAPLSKNTLTEDDVTYMIVHDVLAKNNFEIVAVSYPAAQGDRVMLIEKSTGRTQKRDYIDTIFITPASFTMQENKAKFTLSAVKKDAEKLSTYKISARRPIVDDFIDRYYDGSTPKDAVKRRDIRVGVGFVYEGDYGLSNAQFLDNLDYFIRIRENLEWSIWQCGSHSDFTIHKGTARLPTTYVLTKFP